MPTVNITIELEEASGTFIASECVKGHLYVKVPANTDVSLPGIVINAGSRTTMTQGCEGDSNKASNTNAVAPRLDAAPEPYTQQLRLAMPRNGESALTYKAGSTTKYPFALHLPPDLLPSYYCATVREDDGAHFIASMTYQLCAAISAESSTVSVHAEPVTIQVVPTALPYGPQPRKGYRVDVFMPQGESHQDVDVDADNNSTSDDDDEEEAPASAAPKREKASAGCMGGGNSNHKSKTAAEVDADAARVRRSSQPSGGAVVPRATPGKLTGYLKVSLAMQTAYVCLTPNILPNAKAEAASNTANIVWVEVRLSNQLRDEDVPFQLRLTLKLKTTFKPTNGGAPVENTIVLATRHAKATGRDSGDNDDALELKPGCGTPMRISLVVPQLMALVECGNQSLPKVPAAKPRRTTVAVPPTIETPTFNARTILECDFYDFEGRTKDNAHRVVLEDPVEIVGQPSSAE